MQRLVLTYSSGDDYTCSCEISVPLTYDSVEAAKADFEYAIRVGHADNKCDVFFAGQEFDVFDFMYYSFSEEKHMYDPPYITTVDEWFKEHNQE